MPKIRKSTAPHRQSCIPDIGLAVAVAVTNLSLAAAGEAGLGRWDLTRALGSTGMSEASPLRLDGFGADSLFDVLPSSVPRHRAGDMTVVHQ
jgi:hypothetical protein